MRVDSYQEVQVLSHVHEKPPNHSSKVDDMGGLMLFKDFFRILKIPEGQETTRVSECSGPPVCVATYNTLLFAF